MKFDRLNAMISHSDKMMNYWETYTGADKTPQEVRALKEYFEGKRDGLIEAKNYFAPKIARDEQAMQGLHNSGAGVVEASRVYWQDEEQTTLVIQLGCAAETVDINFTVNRSGADETKH